MKNKNKMIVSSALSLGLAILAVAFTAPVYADSANPKVHGKTVGNWGHAWWQWVVNVPTAVNPIILDGNIDCSVGQSGKVWFLAGNFSGGFGEANPAERTCTVKKNRALFFPLFNAFKWTPLDPAIPEDCTNKKDCRAAASADIDKISSWTCTIDGVPCVWTKQIVRAQSDAKPVNLKAGGIATTDFGYAPGIRKIAVSDGYWVMLDPLPEGEHTLHFTATQTATGFALDVTYHLTVSAL